MSPRGEHFGKDILHLTNGSKVKEAYLPVNTRHNPIPSPNVDPIEVTDTVIHDYTDPGSYTVTLTVEDDDGNVTTATYEIQILLEEDALQSIEDDIQDLPDDAFCNQVDQRQKAFSHMFSAIQNKLAAEEYRGAIRDLLYNIRSKTDGTIDGFPKNDWITDPTAQGIICCKIDALIIYLETLL